MAQTAHKSVLLTVNMAHVDTRTDRVLPVLQVGRVFIVPQVVFTYIKLCNTLRIAFS